MGDALVCGMTANDGYNKLDASETAMIAFAKAGNMIHEAHIPDSVTRVCVLANDIAYLANDEFEGDSVAAARELQSRIGGLVNLESYIRTLVAGMNNQ